LSARAAFAPVFFAVAIALSAASTGKADSYGVANLTPAIGSTISYDDWQAAGRYVTFVVRPDAQFPCGAADYVLEVNGVRVGRFAANCGTRAYLATPGVYSWRVLLLVPELGTGVAGSVTQFAVANLDQRPPTVVAFDGRGRVHHRTYLTFRAWDDSGVESVTVVLKPLGSTVPLKRWKYPLGSSTGLITRVAWVPPKAGRFLFYVAAQDQMGSRVRSRCAALTISS